MDLSFNRNAIVHRLNELDRLDGARKVFGSAVHQYRLQPPLSISVIETLEEHNKVALPGDYRYFITEIGNGGAGPYYGLFSFGKQSDLRGQGFVDWTDAESPSLRNHPLDSLDPRAYYTSLQTVPIRSRLRAKGGE